MVMRISAQTIEFQRQIESYAKKVDDLRLPLSQILKQWYRGNKSLFTLSSPGKYEDLKPNTKIIKEKSLGFVYPILRGETKTLEKAITDPSSPYAYSEITKKSLEMGVEKTDESSETNGFPYAFAHQYGYEKRNLPARPYVLLGIEQVATEEQKNKTKVYIQIIEDYIDQLGK